MTGFKLAKENVYEIIFHLQISNQPVSLVKADKTFLFSRQNHFSLREMIDESFPLRHKSLVTSLVFYHYS